MLPFSSPCGQVLLWVSHLLPPWSTLYLSYFYHRYLLHAHTSVVASASGVLLLPLSCSLPANALYPLPHYHFSLIHQNIILHFHFQACSVLCHSIGFTRALYMFGLSLPGMLWSHMTPVFFVCACQTKWMATGRGKCYGMLYNIGNNI